MYNVSKSGVKGLFMLCVTMEWLSRVGFFIRNFGTLLMIMSLTLHFMGQSKWWSRLGICMAWWIIIWYIFPVNG